MCVMLCRRRKATLPQNLASLQIAKGDLHEGEEREAAHTPPHRPQQEAGLAVLIQYMVSRKLLGMFVACMRWTRCCQGL